MILSVLKLKKRKENKPQLHISCSTISIHSFYSIIQKDDFRFLIKGYDEFQDKEKYKFYKNDDSLNKIFDDLINEYIVLMRDNKTLKKKRDEFMLLHLIFRHNGLIKIMDLYNETDSLEVLELVIDFGIKFNVEKNIPEQVLYIVKQIKGLKNKINISEINFKKKYIKEDSNEDILNNLEKEMVSLEMNLKLGYELNPRKITVERYISLKDIVKVRIEQNN